MNTYSQISLGSDARIEGTIQNARQIFAKVQKCLQTKRSNSGIRCNEWAVERSRTEIKKMFREICTHPDRTVRRQVSHLANRNTETYWIYTKHWDIIAGQSEHWIFSRIHIEGDRASFDRIKDEYVRCAIAHDFIEGNSIHLSGFGHGHYMRKNSCTQWASKKSHSRKR